MIYNILHISDLHIKSDNSLQNIVLKSLITKVKSLVKNGMIYNSIIITGDIAFSGKKIEYDNAKDFIKNLVNVVGCGVEKVYIIPGNHDIDRSMIKPEHVQWFYNYKNEQELSVTLTSDVSFPLIMKKNEAFLEFVKDYAQLNRGKYGEFSEIIYSPDFINIKIIGLNSSLFCGFDGDDKEKLALGIEQVNNCFGESEFDNEIVISCMHHPHKCYHLCEKPTISLLDRNSDIILSGHLHSEDVNSKYSGKTGNTVFVSAGAAYESKNYSNSFNTISINLMNQTGDVTFFKYLPDEHTWTENKDINRETGGVFHFTLSNKSQNNTSDDAKNSGCQKYKVTLKASFDDLNREKISTIIAQLQLVTNDISTDIVKIESGSVRVYFETQAILNEEDIEKITKIDGLDVLEFKKLKDEDIHLLTGDIDKSVYHWKTFLKNDFQNDLSNPGTNFSHNRVDNITLKDLFVSPNLKIVNIEKTRNQKEKILPATEVLKKKSNINLRIVIYGNDNSGKTTLTRWCYENFYDEGYIPIYLNGHALKDISEKKIKKLIQSAFDSQYNGTFKGKFSDYENDRIIIVIDDFQRVRFKEPRFKASLIYNLEKLFKNIVITGNDLMQYDSYTSKTGSETILLQNFDRYNLLEFGPKLRYELIKKWNGLGQNQLDPNELIRLNNETESHVNSIIGKNFVPSYPIYLLTILQAREALTTTQKPEYSLHGFYYELLINDALNKAVKKKEDISLYHNYITEYAYFLFDTNIRLEAISTESLIKFHNYYCVEYNISISYKDVLETLIASKLLKVQNDLISITYKYVYYFFVARYLANNISLESIRDKVKALCERVHRDEFASIVMYLTHLSKDQFILNQLLHNSKNMFIDYKPIALEQDVSFINEMIKKLPAQIYEPIDVAQAREEELDNIEEMEQMENDFDTKKDVFDYSLSEDVSALDMISNLIRAVKTIEIVGQVTKKYWGELKATQKFELAEETYMLGLRTLGYYYSIISEDTDMLINYLNNFYKKRFINQQLKRAQIDKATKNYLFGICTMASYGIIKRITNAIGYDKLAGTFEDLLKKYNNNAVKLIDTSIKLEYHSKFPWSEVVELKTSTENNYLSKAVLQNLLINYLYIYNTTIEEKQRICSYVDISMDTQRQIEAQSVTKKEGKSNS